MNGLALFAGYGGIEHGLRIAIPEYRTVCYVEQNAYAASTLMAGMEGSALDKAPIWDDVTTFDGNPWRGKVDLIAGGFPCQDVSIAGRKEGLQEGNRSGLWIEFARIICEIRPRFAFIENVPDLLIRGGHRVLCDLAKVGFDAVWDCFSAREMGAPHARSRVFFLAYPIGVGSPRSGFRGFDGRTNEKEWLQSEFERLVRTESQLSVPTGKSGRVADGAPNRIEQLHMLGNGVVPLVAAYAFRTLAARAGVEID